MNLELSNKIEEKRGQSFWKMNDPKLVKLYQRRSETICYSMSDWTHT